MAGVILSVGQQVAATVIDLMQGVPPWLIVLLIAALPIVELRLALPIALLTLKLPVPEAILFSVLGNMLPIPFILYLLGPASRFLVRWKMFDRFFTWLFERTKRRSKSVERFEIVGLILFVAIPLPVTGAWTGSVAAYLAGFPVWRSFLFIFIGVCIASVVVTLATMGVLGAVSLIQ